ncbi:MAG: glycosyltransferase [Proteobacteria bacterium]|nr:glycosyltransferase [Pseudomonadota bacterium]
MRDKKHVVCIVSPNKFAYSETFIRAHIERIPAKVKVLYGGWFPTHNEGDRPLISLFQRCIHLAFQKIFDVNPKRFQIAALRRYLRRERVEVVLAEYGPTGVSVMEACRSEGIPLIVHFHGFDASAEVTLERYSKDYKYMFGLSSAIIVVSRDMMSKLLALGAPGEKLHYNPYGVDCDLFLPGDPSSNPPVFVSIGRFAEKKAPHLTLLAFHKVHQQHPDAQLVMIGDGPLLDACKLLTHALHLSSVVEFLGVRSHSDVAAIMRTARAFVQHSVRAPSGDSEGTPVAVLEGGAAGLPVVATRHGGIRDIVIEEETGLLVDEGDIEGMADQMLRLAKDADLAARLGRAARKRVFTEFSMEKSIGQLWEIMIRAIDKE